METLDLSDVGALSELVGTTVGPSGWRQVTQEMIDDFAHLSGDHQWIHTDTERAAAESPFGTTIAHGNLTLSMIDGFRDTLVDATGVTMGVNYGWDKVRFPAPVPAGALLRASCELREVTDVGGGWTQVIQRFTVEIEGTEKPACVADSVVRLLVA